MQQQSHKSVLDKVYKAASRGEGRDNALFKAFAQWLVRVSRSSTCIPTGHMYLSHSGIKKEELVIMLRRWINAGLVMDTPSSSPALTFEAMLVAMSPEYILTSGLSLRMRGKSLAVSLGVVGVELPSH